MFRPSHSRPALLLAAALLASPAAAQRQGTPIDTANIDTKFTRS